MAKKKIDVLVCEIGSTTTVVNAFDGMGTDNPTYVGQGFYRTTVDLDDVSIGVKEAIKSLEKNLGYEIEYKDMFATSSAAGGLKMTVHGLVYDMTAKAAFEAALGAGANIKLVTSGKLRDSEVHKIIEIQPNIILIAGGVDHGERETALENSQRIADLNFNVPVIYAGNIDNHDEIREIFAKKGKEKFLTIVDNVYPSIDLLNVEPARKVIHDVFEEHIIHAKGMSHIRDVVTEAIIPTPGAVMESSKILYEVIGDLVTIDVGGATTDIHSVTEGSEDIAEILQNPEPMAKRTVEGDLGVYVNRIEVLKKLDEKKLLATLGWDKAKLEEVLANYKPIPETDDQKKLVIELTKYCVYQSIDRHAGSTRKLYGTAGMSHIAEGKDLTAIKWIVGTGGALTRLGVGEEIMSEIHAQNKLKTRLYPNNKAKMLLDNDYIMASLGVLSRKYKPEAIALLKKSLNIK